MGKAKKPIIKSRINRRNILKNLKRIKENIEKLNKIKSEL